MPVPYQQLYAQLKRDLKQGLPYYPAKEFEQTNEKHNALCYETNVVEEYFYKHFSFAREGEEGAKWMTTTELHEFLTKQLPMLKKEVTSAKSFGKKLKNMAARYCERERLNVESIYDHQRNESMYCVVFR